MDLALNNLQRLICHKTKQTKPNLCHLRAMECLNIHIISPQVVALLFYANEYLLTTNEHYQ